VRIIAGSLKGRRLTAPKGLDVRPTSDSLRETLFNVLGGTLEPIAVLDAYAGTGALGLEALSRGAASVDFVERDAAALRALRTNVDACGVGDACRIARGDFLMIALDREFGLVLLDPPYAEARTDAILARAAAVTAAGGRVVLEHSRRRESPVSADRLLRYRVLTAGDSALSFYERRH
jgi:16S rRNA (guanine(966)-N(2))-methyltransferase RsmD